jgi:hypothetical protein
VGSVSICSPAGLIVRVQDEDNTYIARANALEGNVRFYKVENGRREPLAGVDLSIPTGEWQSLGLRMSGNRAEILLNGEGPVQRGRHYLPRYWPCRALDESGQRDPFR